MSHIAAVLSDYFGSNSSDEHIHIKYLAGGYLAISIQLNFASKAHVLRVISKLEPPLRRNTELYAMKNAATTGIAPAIHWISPDGYGILMDYITGGTLTIERSKEPEVIAEVADLLHKVHTLPKNPFYSPSFEEHMKKFYNRPLATPG